VSSTVGLAGPTRDIRLPRNRAVVMLIIDVSPSMESTDVSPTRLEAAKEAGKQFADELTPGINLGSIAFGGSARPPARIVLLSDGKENLPPIPMPQGRVHRGAPRKGARRADLDDLVRHTVWLRRFRRSAPSGACCRRHLEDSHDLSGGKIYHAADINQLKDVHATLQSQFGYETTRGDASGGWFRSGVIAVTMAALAGLAINRRLPS